MNADPLTPSFAIDDSGERPSDREVEVRRLRVSAPADPDILL
jgi:hypothetical protein